MVPIAEFIDSNFYINEAQVNQEIRDNPAEGLNLLLQKAIKDDERVMEELKMSLRRGRTILNIDVELSDYLGTSHPENIEIKFNCSAITEDEKNQRDEYLRQQKKKRELQGTVNNIRGNVKRLNKEEDDGYVEYIDGRRLTSNERLFQEMSCEEFDEAEWLKKNGLDWGKVGKGGKYVVPPENKLEELRKQIGKMKISPEDKLEEWINSQNPPRRAGR
jgi:hypothetical protein